MTGRALFGWRYAARCLSSALATMVLSAGSSAWAQLTEDVLTATVTASRPQVYVNETFQLTMSVTSFGVATDSNMQLSSMPDRAKISFGDFHELAPEQSMQNNQVRLKRRFSCEARALTAGTIDYAPTLRVNIITGNGFFRQFSPYDIRPKPLTLPVLPVPENGKPATFSGAIGQFTLDVTINPTEIAPGELITATLKISGKGYLDPVSTLSISPGSNFKAYPSKLIPGTAAGEKTFEQVLVPQNTNATLIPPVSLVFFDPLSGNYQTVSRGPFPITFHQQKKLTPAAIYKPKAQNNASRGAKEDTLTERTLATRSAPRFRVMAISAYWLVVVVLSAWIALKSTRGSLFAVLIMLAAAIVFLALRVATGHAPASDATVLRSEKARLAPAYSAVISFEVARESTVRVLETSSGWSKIQVGDKKGWFPSDALTNSATEGKSNQ